MTVYIANYPEATNNGMAYDHQKTAVQDAIQTYGTNHIAGVTVGTNLFLSASRHWHSVVIVVFCKQIQRLRLERIVALSYIGLQVFEYMALLSKALIITSTTIHHLKSLCILFLVFELELVRQRQHQPRDL